MREILLETLCGQTTLALYEEGELCELYIERKGLEKLAGNVYVGRVENVLPGMNAAFVDIGLDKNAFLFAGDIQIDVRDAQELADKLKQAQIQKIVRPGQELMVQVVKEPGGTKGPRISCHVTLPGRLTVLLPTVEYVGISRRIEDDEQRNRLKKTAEALAAESGMGMIVRTAAATATDEELIADYEALIRLWGTIYTRSKHSKAPVLLHRDDSLVYRAVRDMLDESVDAIRTDNAEIYEQLREITASLAPQLLDRIMLNEGETPLFDKYGVYAHAERALQRKIWLKSGGYLVIDYTEALTVIDVNTGKFVGKHSLEETILKTNIEAAKEIAKQLRLRDIGGIIIIDFIDMNTPEQREELLKEFAACLKRDRTRTNLAGMTELGLVEMTRKKLRQPIFKLLTHACQHCQGSGLTLAYETTARLILNELRTRAASGNTGALLVKAAPPVISQLLNIEPLSGFKTYALADEALSENEYSIQPVQESALPPKTRVISR